MRLMRWSAELAIEPDVRKARLGIDQLWALASSNLLGEEEKSFVDAAFESALEDVISVARRVEDANDDVNIREVETDGTDGERSLPLVGPTDEGAADGY